MIGLKESRDGGHSDFTEQNLLSTKVSRGENVTTVTKTEVE